MLNSTFPPNDGGLFYIMIEELQANHFALPSYTSYNRRMIPFAIILLPVLSYHLSLTWDNWAASRVVKLVRRLKINSPPKELPLKTTRFPNGILISIIVLAALGNLYILTRSNVVDECYPVAAIQWIKENWPEGALFNSYNWGGGYLIWNLREHPVFIDGCADLYGDELIGQWKQVTAGSEEAQ